MSTIWNKRTRFIAALKGEAPDRVPAAPDISNMVPCRRTGKPFWDIYLHGDPPLWKAHLDANRAYGFDAWFYRGSVGVELEHTNETKHRIVATTDERITQETTLTNRLGDLTSVRTFPIADSPWPEEKPIKVPSRDIPIWIESLGRITGFSPAPVVALRKEVGDEFALGFSFNYPGFHYWVNFFDGGILSIMDTHMNEPHLLQALREIQHQQTLAKLEYTLTQNPDYVFIGASGTITMASPDLFREYGLPTLKAVTARCKEAGVPTLLHSCGKAWDLVRIATEETDLTCINPLEEPPMGDCVLADVKESFGDKIALMGNLHTTNVMLFGSRDTVLEESKKAIEAAGPGGGFILSTGDQCGRDTPDENLYAVVEATERYGRY